MNAYLLGVLFFLLAGLISLFFGEKYKGYIFSCLCGIGALLAAFSCVKVLLGGSTLSAVISNSYIFGPLKLELDPLSAFFALLVAVAGFVNSIYAAGYLTHYYSKKMPVSSHYFFLSLLYGSMLLLPAMRNAIYFLIVWEVMSLSSFFLIMFESEKKEVFDAGISYLVIMHAGVLMLIAGFSVIYSCTGSFDFAAASAYAKTAGAGAACVLLFAGFAVKAGFMPGHTWLPAAYPAAPGHVSAIMSGVMSKLGVYGILRAFLIAGMPDLLFSYIFLAISLLSAFLGAVYASGQRDLKRALAYSSVENMGIIGAGLATGLIGLNLGNMPAAVLGFAGALIHIVNHSLFKQALFFGAGSVYISTHTRDIETLGGLSRKMPYTAFFFLVSAASISALPPFNGFISEFFVYRSLIENALTGNPAAIAAAAFGLAAVSITGGIIVICFTRLYGIVFAGSERSEKAEHATEVGLLMLFPAGLLVAMCVAIGIFPQPIIRLVMEPVMMFTGTGSGSTFAAVFSGVPVISGYFASFAAFAALLYFFRKLLLRGRVQTKAATWTCGYSRPNPRMQYSAYSYSQQIMNLAEPFVIKEKELKRPEGIFPSKAYSEHHIKDIFEQLIIKPAGFVVKKGLALFSWVQSGNLQHYLLYGIFLLILALMFAWVK